MKDKFSTDGYGNFILSDKEMLEKWWNIKALVFDWDGVFNNGMKDLTGASPFSEIDAMGTNMLRLSYYLRTQQLPITAVISGEHNPMARRFVEREKFNALYSGVKQKMDALRHLCATYELAYHEVLFVFDDLLDISAARECGLRMMVYDPCKIETIRYAGSTDAVDYTTRFNAGQGAVREVCELLIGMSNNSHDTFDVRVNFDYGYRHYLSERDKVQTGFYGYDLENGILEQKL